MYYWIISYVDLSESFYCMVRNVHIDTYIMYLYILPTYIPPSRHLAIHLFSRSLASIHLSSFVVASFNVTRYTLYLCVYRWTVFSMVRPVYFIRMELGSYIVSVDDKLSLLSAVYYVYTQSADKVTP